MWNIIKKYKKIRRWNKLKYLKDYKNKSKLDMKLNYEF